MRAFTVARPLGFLALGIVAFLAAPVTAQQSNDMAQAGWDLMTGSPEQHRAGINAIVARNNPDMIPTLILAMRFRRTEAGALSRSAAAITGARGTGWFDWMLWQEQHPEFPAHESYASLKLAVFAKLDPNFLRFLKPESVNPADMKIRLEEITWGGVVVDGIPALDNPELIAADDAEYLRGDDLVFGVEINGDARAYPLRIMGWHEMFNDVIGGVPVALAYCTLCGAGILFETGGIEGQAAPLIFGSSGFLYRSNKLMFDRQTDSLWNQFTGEPVVGPLVHSGIKLKQRPVVITSWDNWKAGNPSTRVLSLETGHRRDYGSGVVYDDYFASPDLMFPAIADQTRLRQKDYVFGVRVALYSKAWPVSAFKGGRVLNDAIGPTPLVLIGDAKTRTVRAYKRGKLRFSKGIDSGEIVDAEGNTWRVEENALIGPAGIQAPRVAGHVAYWFAWDGYLGVKSELYSAQ